MSTDAPPPPTPESLFALWRSNRDPAALGALFDGAAPGLFRLALTLVPDAATAEDALQETFVFAMEAADRWDPSRPVVPWLAGILRNKVLEVRRRNARTPRPERVPPPPPPDDPLLNAATAEERERVRVALLSLEEPYREAALLRWRYGLEPAEIAEVKGVPPGTVSSWLHRAVEKLRVEMGALPAVMAVAFPERGLVGVKTAVLKSATAPALATTAAVGGGTAAALTIGGLAMANKVAVAAVVLAAIATGGWFATRPASAPPPSPPGSVVALSDTQVRPSVPAPVPPPAASDPGLALPPAVDLSRCDRDLDLFGEVVNEKGTAVAGADVASVRRPWRRLSGVGFPRYAETVDGPSTKTAGDGTFALRIGKTEVVDLVVQAKGFPDTLVPSCPSGGRIRVVLKEGARVEVSATDPEGRPVAGARVRLQQKPSGPAPVSDRTGTTDDAGLCVLTGFTAGRSLLTAEHDDLGGPQPQLKEVPASGTLRVDLKFVTGRAVTGTVLDATTGKPLAGARVGVDPFHGRSVLSDAEGKYRFAPWPTSSGDTLTASMAGFAGLIVDVPPSGDAPVDFALAPGDVVTGRLLHRPDDAPAAGAHVLVVGRGNIPGAARQVDYLDAVSDSEGRFRIEGLNHALGHTMVVDAPGSGRLVCEVPPPAAPGIHDLGDISLPEPKLLTGVLVDGRGDPIPGKLVSLTGSEGGPSDNAFPETRWTDDLGRFAFPGLSMGGYRLTTWIGSDPFRVDVVIPYERDAVEVRLVAATGAASGGRLEVRVLDAQDKPVAGATVQAHVEGKRPVTGTCDDAGKVELLDLQGPRVLLRVFAPRSVAGTSRFLTPAPVEAEVGGPPVVVHLAESALIRGKVVGPDGKPLPRMAVNAKGPDKAAAWGNTNDRGEFELSMAGGVPFQVEINGWQFAENSSKPEISNLRASAQEVIAPADGIVFTMHTVASGKTLTLHVVTPEGRPIPFCSVVAPNQRGDGFPYTDKDGRVTLKDLFEEDTRILLLESGGRVGEPFLPPGLVLPAPLRVIPRDQEITLTLRKGEPRTGRVLDMEGKPRRDACVSLQTDDYLDTRGWTDAEGRFTVWTSPGCRLIRATASTFPSAPGDPRFQADLDDKAKPGCIPQEGEIVLRLEPWKERN